MSRLLIAWVIVAQVGAAVVRWRLLIWLVRGRNPWREPPRWPWRGEPMRTMSGAARQGNEADAVVPQS